MKKLRLKGVRELVEGFSNYEEVPGNLAPKFAFVTIMLYGSDPCPSSQTVSGFKARWLNTGHGVFKWYPLWVCFPSRRVR